MSGFVIVDEEQRFGVKHKERLKQLKKNVDSPDNERHPDSAHAPHVAAGIARYVGDRDAAQGPAGHQTVVAHFHRDLIRTAIEQELARQGQSTSCTTASTRS